MVGNEGIDTKAANFRSLAQKAVSAGADCVFFGVTANKGVQLSKDLHAADPELKLFGPDGLAEPAFTTKIGNAEAATYLTAPVLPPTSTRPRARTSSARSSRSTGTSRLPTRSTDTRR